MSQDSCWKRELVADLPSSSVIKEHLHRRNGRWSPDARDVRSFSSVCLRFKSSYFSSLQHFDFGTSVQLRLTQTFNLLHATLETLSSNQPLFLIFHDPRADLRALHTLGFEHEVFAKTVADAAASNAGIPKEGMILSDTQALYSAWAGVPVQTGLSKCCEALQVRL